MPIINNILPNIYIYIIQYNICIYIYIQGQDVNNDLDGLLIGEMSI